MALHGDGCRFCDEAERELHVIANELDCSKQDSCESNGSNRFQPYRRPILLQHFPLFRLNDNDCLRDEDFDEDDPNRNDPYRPKWEALSKESTELLLQKLEPRAVFNGHSHRGCKKRFKGFAPMFKPGYPEQVVFLRMRAVRPSLHWPLCPAFLSVFVIRYAVSRTIMREPMFTTQSPENEVSVARAIYNNESEFDEELPFQRGDVLRVLSERPEIEGISEGWWLCVDKDGRKGLAPANRLQVMHRFDKGFFQVANPLFDDFYMFNQPSSSPFDDPFFRVAYYTIM
ncbi:variant SH3 domain protein [Teladorsagia circumcincta]|uniref:Variant SH3 domain protein n=1 Tax=Teladorsagia circumcincta TaxID=45464 RepID=A0A2G9UU81_TELCI|nr:variant SH3 domain protein [Teladorsagia circumcincta]